MNVCDYADRLEAYHDGELPPDQRRAVEDHLGGCPACRRELARLRELSRVLVSAPVPEAPAGLVARLRSGLPRPETEIIRICRIASMAAAALLLACAALLLNGEPPAQARAEAPAAWEVAAVTRDANLVQADWRETYAVWVVDDLSRENGQ